MRLLIYDNEYEPVSAVVLKNQKKLNIQTLHLQKLIDNVEIFDEFDSKKTKLNWYLSKNRKITNSNTTFVINRIFNFSDDFFSDFSLQDKEYAKSEFWSYLIFSLNSFKNITERPGIGALTGKILSLPHQYTFLKDNEVNILLPDFYCGPYELIPKEIKNNSIFTSPYNFYHWKVNKPKKEQEDNVFAIKKPNGIPILAFNVGNKVFLYDQDSKKSSKLLNQEKKIKKVSKEIHKLFGYFISEILFFVEDKNITFAMISNKTYGSAYAKEFEPEVLSALNIFFES